MKEAVKLGQQAKNHNKKRRPVAAVLLFFCVVIAVFVSLSLLTGSETVPIDDAAKLKGFDYASHIAHIEPEAFDWYPKALYTPKDFAAGRVTQSPQQDDGKSIYYTYRLLLELEEGRVYGISGYSATHAQTLWVNGKVYSSVGVPGDSANSMTPKSNYYAVYFTAEPGPTEIIIQRSSFVHANTGQLTPLNLAEQALITLMNNRVLLQVSVMLGCTLMAALFFFGIFLFVQNRKYFLWFSLSCLLIVVRIVTVDYKLIMNLLPDLNWELALKLEYISTGLFPFFVILFVNAVFDYRLNRRLNIACSPVFFAYIVFVLAAPAIVYTRFKDLFLIFVMAYVVLVMLQGALLIARKREYRRAEQVLVVVGGIAYIVAALVDVYLYPTGGRYDNTNFTKIGTMMFVFANTLALTLNFQRIEAELAQARESGRELDETNRLLGRLNDMKTEFMANISHEMKTPLTIMSANAQLSKALLRSGAEDAEIIQSLDVVSDEAQRLARMVGEVLDLSGIQEGRGNFSAVDIAVLLKKTAEVYRTLLAKKDNTIKLCLPDGLPWVRGDADMLVQVAVNIIANANAHTQNGIITISAEQDGGMVAVKVEDTGEGIPPGLLPELFERGSGDQQGGAGLGLPICMMIVERHGGSISVESQPGQGAAIRFTLPVYTKGGSDGA